MPDKFADPYLDPETGILRNLVGARNYDELENAEEEFASSRATEFVEHGVFRPTGSLADFQRIHRALFQDISLRFSRTGFFWGCWRFPLGVTICIQAPDIVGLSGRTFIEHTPRACRGVLTQRLNSSS